MNNWKEEFKKILNANYVGTGDLLKAVEKFIENLLEEAKKEERDRLGELLFSKIIWTDDIAKIFKKGSICINCHNK